MDVCPKCDGMTLIPRIVYVQDSDGNYQPDHEVWDDCDLCEEERILPKATGTTEIA